MSWSIYIKGRQSCLAFFIYFKKSRQENCTFLLKMKLIIILLVSMSSQSFDSLKNLCLLTGSPISSQTGSEWAAGFTRDVGQSADSSMVRLDGKTGVTVPETILPPPEFPKHKFTISSWMRHRENPLQDKHTKEHIMCKADDHRKLFTSR